MMGRRIKLPLVEEMPQHSKFVALYAELEELTSLPADYYDEEKDRGPEWRRARIGEIQEAVDRMRSAH